MSLSDINEEGDKTNIGIFEKSMEQIVERAVKKELSPILKALEVLIVDKEYTVNEVAAILDKSPITVRSWIKKRVIGWKMTGKSYRITQRQLEEFIKTQKQKRPHFRKNRKHNQIQLDE